MKHLQTLYENKILYKNAAVNLYKIICEIT